MIYHINSSFLEKAVYFLAAGDVIVLPTDTLYALSADATSYEAVAKIFSIKKRSQSKSIPVFFDSLERVRLFCEINSVEKTLMQLFWPGKLSVVLKVRDGLASNLSGNGKIAARIPKSELIRNIIKKLGKPITATSANISCKANIYSYESLKAEFANDVSLIINGEIQENALPSTIVDCSNGSVRFLRVGAVKEKDILEALF